MCVRTRIVSKEIWNIFARYSSFSLWYVWIEIDDGRRRKSRLSFGVYFRCERKQKFCQRNSRFVVQFILSLVLPYIVANNFKQLQIFFFIWNAPSQSQALCRRRFTFSVQFNFFFFSFRLLHFDNFFCVFLQFCFCFSVIAVYRVSNRCECTSAYERVCVVVVIVIAVSLESVCKCTRISIKRNELRSSIVVLFLIIIVICSLSFTHVCSCSLSRFYHSFSCICLWTRKKKKEKMCDPLYWNTLAPVVKPIQTFNVTTAAIE